MRKALWVAATVLTALAIFVAPAAAITGNYVQDFEHPFVGLAVFYNADGEFVWRCSGSLLSPTVFLTAGHCTDSVGEEGPGTGAATARVYFQQDAGVHYDPATQVDPVSGYPEYCAAGTEGVSCAFASHVYNYGFANFAGFPNTHDAGLVILDVPINLPEYGQLAGAGALDGLSTQRGLNNTIFTVSGYGLSYRQNVHNGKPNLSFRERLMGTATLVNLGSAYTDGYNLQTQGNGDGRAGTCSGDSGGPVFLGDTASNVIVGVTSFGLNQLCRGTDYAYRTDRAAVLDWIHATVGDALWGEIAP